MWILRGWRIRQIDSNKCRMFGRVATALGLVRGEEEGWGASFYPPLTLDSSYSADISSLFASLSVTQVQNNTLLPLNLCSFAIFCNHYH